MGQLISFNSDVLKAEIKHFMSKAGAVRYDLVGKFIEMDSFNHRTISFCDSDTKQYYQIKWLNNARFMIDFSVAGKKEKLVYDIIKNELHLVDAKDKVVLLENSENCRDSIFHATIGIHLGKQYLTEYLPYLE